MLFSTPWYGTVLYCIVSGQYAYLRETQFTIFDFNSHVQRMSVPMESEVLELPKVLGLKRCQGCQWTKGAMGARL